MKMHITKSDDETRKLAADFALQLKGGEVVELVGDLGSGKTTFVRGVAEALGSSVRVKSPTFTIMNEYPVNHKAIKKIVHLDLYRFTDPSQLQSLGLDEYKRDDTVVFIEWPDIFDLSIFKGKSGDGINSTHKIEFEFVDQDTRNIKL
ncbi:MAG: tRNA (adenosine(37)-N6)-threonylcarbamoyltransferase complex ATPase subunit type 1 TsaE [Candidatus Uhrbacteria bacterium]|nr:tRNA (adenosine(37)-N6)-threonylcarbamoyltransferase complex ATPase subunit type 1 TsaE [Candidatus Uhrbacteria bacterium]